MHTFSSFVNETCRYLVFALSILLVRESCETEI
jgi:hypothetical protein